MANVTFKLTASNGSYFIDGKIKPVLNITSGLDYQFDMSDPSLVDHPLWFSYDGNPIQDALVTSVGERGVDQIITITAPSIGGGLFEYYCINHTGMGAEVVVSRNNILGTDVSDTLSGSSGDDLIDALGGDDTILDGAGNDQVYAGAGDDTIYNSGGSDLFDGGSGSDTLSVNISSGFDERSFEVGFDTVAGTHGRLNSTVGQDTISGIENFTLIGNFNAVVTGGYEDNIFITDAGDDILSGGDGNDKIQGGAGKDTLDGGAGDDTLRGESGEDTILGGGGNDQILGGLGNDLLDGGAGNDRISFWDVGYASGVTVDLMAGSSTDEFGFTDELINIESVNGTNFNDVLSGDNLDNGLDGSGGDDLIYGYGGSDGLWGREGADTIYGGDGRDFLIGFSGNDYIDGGEGFDKLRYDLDAQYGGTFGIYVNLINQTARDGFGNTDTVLNIYEVLGTTYDDTMLGDFEANKLLGADGDDDLDGNNGNDIIYGGGGNDKLTAGDGDDQLFGGAGDDVFHDDWGGNDTFDGGSGIDSLYFPTKKSGITVDVNEGTIESHFSPPTWSPTPEQDELDTIVSIEKFGGTNFKDEFYGSAENETFWGFDGNDSLNGGAGDDTLSGGSGSDKFIFEAGFGNDIITDFTHGVDELKFYDANGNLLTSTDISETQNEDGDAVLTVSDGSSVTLSGVSVYTLPFSVVSQKSADTVTFSFFLDPNQDPGDTGVGSFNATLEFEPSNLTYVSASFADGLTGVSNATAVDSGTLGLGGFGLTPVTDLDTALFSVTFEANAVTDSVQLTLSEVEIDATSLAGGTYTIDLTGATLTGSVVTRSGTALSDVLLETDTGLSTQTSSVGAYELDLSGSEQLLSGSLSFSNKGSTKAISAADALDALKLSVGLPTDAGVSDAFSLISADFDQNGKVTASDALEILKYSVGLPAEQNAQWVFLDTNADYSDVSRSITNYTEGVSLADITSDATIGLTGILIGDVNDSYSGLIA